MHMVACNAVAQVGSLAPDRLAQEANSPGTLIGSVLCRLQVMVCIEPAVAGSGPVKLAPGASWSGSQTLVSS